MGGPTGFAVVTSSSSSSLALRHGTTMHGGGGRDDRSDRGDDDRNEYLAIMRQILLGYVTGFDSKGNLRFDPNFYFIQDLRKLTFPLTHTGRPNGSVVVPKETLPSFNHGIVSCLTTTEESEIHMFWLAYRLTDMFNVLSTVTDDELLTITETPTYSETEKEYVDVSSRRMERIALESLPECLYDVVKGKNANTWFVEVMCFADAAFLEKFVTPQNAFMVSYRGAVTRGFNDVFEVVEETDTYIIRDGSWLHRFLDTRWVRKTFGDEANVKTPTQRVLWVETCLGIFRILCVVPFVKTTVRGQVTSPYTTFKLTELSKWVQSEQLSCIGNIHMHINKDDGTTTPHHAMPLLRSLLRRDIDAELFRPGLRALYTFLVDDVRVLEPNPEILNTTGVIAEQYRTFLFVVALMYRACEPYETESEEVANHVRDYLTPLFEVIRDMLIVHKDPPLEAMTERLKFNHDRTKFMRERLAKAFVRTYLPRDLVIKLDEILWERPPKKEDDVLNEREDARSTMP